MKKYSEMEKAKILSYPIESILAHFGKRTDHRGYMYYSPLRVPEEKTPSFKIDRNRNVWCDHGSENREGGNNIQLVSKLGNIPLSEAWDYIAALDPISITEDIISPGRKSPQSSRISVDRIYEKFIYRRFIEYSNSRGIPSCILEFYCKQVVYHIGQQNRQQWHAIGFPTNDGWVLRHTKDGNYSKRCTSSSCTFLDKNGERTEKASCEQIEVFEGFFDFMSWLVLNERTRPLTDICVLNSVSNISSAMEFISSHKSISCWLDNDAAGEKAFNVIKTRCEVASSHIKELQETGCKDVNELLLKSSGKNQGTGIKPTAKHIHI